MAGEADYAFELVRDCLLPSVKVAVLTLRLTDFAQPGRPVEVPLSFATRVDYEPDGYGDDEHHRSQRCLLKRRGGVPLLPPIFDWKATGRFRLRAKVCKAEGRGRFRAAQSLIRGCQE